MRKKIRNEIVESLSVLEIKFRQIKETSQTAMFVTCVVLLQSIKKKCKSNLSEQRGAYYIEIFDGILLALQKRERLQHESLVEVCDLCTELLQFVTKELLQEKEVTKEILFLPYKASMWDSLESIWRAAAADTEHCEAYVVPIPYCDRNPDGSAAQWHCEIDLFPEDVPVLDYKAYDLAVRQPDVIYIHNPYDGTNTVTSVDPRYYSYELKKHTDMLVYVPYFIVGPRWPEVQAKLPCYDYIDKMITQHDKTLIDPMNGSLLLEKNVKYLDDYISEDILVPLGSPKADRMFFCEKNKKIPNAWKKQIQGKKVILYNISISGLLQHGDKILNKMKYVFSSFAGREDVVLLWRPHPLLESTMKSMRIDLYEKYQNLKKVFIKNKIGVFDETPDINMAVAVSDAYLGESSSSIVNLFGIAAKPVFFTDDILLWSTPSNEELASILFNYIKVDKDNIYFVADGYNVFCRMNVPTGEIEEIVKFDDFPVSGGAYSTFAQVKENVVFAPLNEKIIALYNLKSKKTTKIPFEEPFEYGNFSRIIAYRHYAFLFPLRYGAILRLDINTGECKYYKDYMKVLESYQRPMHEEFFGIETICENKVLIPSLQSNKIMEFDMETERFSFYDLPEGKYDCWKIISDKDDIYWLIPWKTRAIRKWNKRENTCEVFNDYPEKYECMQDWFTGITYHFIDAVKKENNIWLFPAYGNLILCLDMLTGNITESNMKLPYDIYDRKSNFYLQQLAFFAVGIYGQDKIIGLSSYDRSLIIYDTQTEKIEIKPCRFTEKQVKCLSNSMEKSFGQLNRNILYASTENHLWRNIDSFIDYVISEKHNHQAQKEAYLQIITNADGSCGEKVHKYIMEQIV